MKRIVVIFSIFCMCAGFGCAQSKAKTAEITLKGSIIDNRCAVANKDNLADFVKTHTKDCALLPACAASGYSLYADGKPVAFDKESNKKIESFLKKKESTLDVIVNAAWKGKELHLLSIKNQK